ncbi:MAG TPA: DUF6247 family protein [Pseudonocardiaceae bacterium]
MPDEVRRSEERDRESSAARGAVAAARAMYELLARVDDAAVTAVLIDEFPWAAELPESERAEFVADFIRELGVSAESGQWAGLARTLQDWRVTAAVHADPGVTC